MISVRRRRRDGAEEMKSPSARSRGGNLGKRLRGGEEMEGNKAWKKEKEGKTAM